MAKCYHLKVPDDGEFGSDVDGFKPILFDVGRYDEKMKMKQTLAKCHQLFGEKAVVLYMWGDGSAKFKVNKMKQGPWLWEYNDAESYYALSRNTVLSHVTTHETPMYSISSLMPISSCC